MSLYVYGIVPSPADVPELVGVQGERVTTVESNGQTALVSQVEDGEEIGTPENLLAHSAVLDRIAADRPVLPMVFGTLVPDAEALVERVLAPGHNAYAAQFARVGDSAQFTLHARFVADQALAELVEEDHEISALRRAISGSSEDETREERIRLGELVVRGLHRKATAEAQPVREAIVPLALEVVEREPGQADDVIELAALVERHRQAEFERTAEDFARRSAGRITFRLLGPQAPYDFMGVA
ncbi:GvpL/GvpF family gas vesicle protein [Sinomonas sp. P47F7]|uniref:GvpL/GvpF family gas vesicle protein n=1 Tax=Sinomonas sp. P47F7 TaxID=3410987 RepID=UPI003BF5162C